MTPIEARGFIAWFVHNHLPKGAAFVRTSSGRELYFDKLTDEDAVFVAQEFEAMFDAATRKK
jgi:hypothetical protein